MKASHPIAIAILLAMVLFALTIPQQFTNASRDRTSASANILSTDEMSAVTTYVPASYISLPNGDLPFLKGKPYRENYTSPAKLHSFFDHRLPVYTAESSVYIPQDLRDEDGVTVIFTGEERSSGGQGVSYYSGHNGIDFGDRPAAATLQIQAPADGIILTGRETSYCKIWIGHDASIPPDNVPDYATFYTHMSNMADAPLEQRQREGRDQRCGTKWCVDDTIELGALIGTEGDEDCEGWSDGNHLHFGVIAGALDGTSMPRIFDPFGWWSSDPDPWADSRVTADSHLEYLSWTPQTSYWLWAAPESPAFGEADYWGTNVVAQTDDRDASFHRFTPIGRELEWRSLLPSAENNIDPIGDGAWRSTSLVRDGTSKSWAVWALHVPETADYQIQVHIPETPDSIPAPTDQAVYEIYEPLPFGTVSTWESNPIDQNRNNEWVTLQNSSDNSDSFEFRAGSIILVKLTDVTGEIGETVLFDAVRLYQEAPGEPPPTEVRRVGFVVDNTTSMRESGKIDAIRTSVPPWIDALAASDVSYFYSLEAFAENVPPVSVTDDPEEMNSWVSGLTANDNGIGNYDCPEASLGAIRALTPHAQGGDILFFTDDLPHNPITERPGTAVALANAQAKLHAIILPKTCWISGGGDPTGWLTYRLLTLSSGGTYQSVTTDQTTNALEIVLSEMEANAELGVISSGNAQTVENGILRLNDISETYDVLVDGTISQANFLLNILDGNLTLNVYRPDSTPVMPSDPDINFIDSGSAKYYQVTDPDPGTWQVEITGTGEFLFRSSAISSISLAYLGEAFAPKGEPMYVAARISGQISTLIFSLETTDGQPVATVSMYDNGTLGDISAGDGVYAGSFTPAQEGYLRMNISGTTDSGQSFSRLDTRQIRVTGIQVAAPDAADIMPGSTQVLTFMVSNLGDTAGYFNLEATSTADWLNNSIPSSIYLDAGESAPIYVSIRVPFGVMPNAVDIVRLTAERSDDATELSDDTTNIFVPDIDYRFPFDSFLPISVKD